MTIKNYDEEIEKRGHPENFEAGKTVYNPLIKPIKVKLSAKRGSAKEAKSVQHKHRAEK